MREINFKVTSQGNVKLVGNKGLKVIDAGDLIGFYLEADDRAYVLASKQSEDNCPVICLDSCFETEGEELTEIVFHELKGFEFFGSNAGRPMTVMLKKK